MSVTKFRYLVHNFNQRPQALRTGLFVAPAEDVGTWAGVPQKSSRFMRGFQRVEDEDHWKEIADYFDKPKNISPTAIVIAFKPDRARLVPLDEAIVAGMGGDRAKADAALAAFSKLPQHAELPMAVLEVEAEDYSTLTIPELATRVHEELTRPSSADGQITALEGSPDNDGEFEEEDEEEDDEADDEADDTSTLGTTETHASHLHQFLTFLKDSAALEAAEKEDSTKLRGMLENLLKPATIVDGQHRTRGAAFLERRILFPIVALFNADWREQVFQFVVINQRAKPIQPEFLSAIISSSLSVDDVRKMHIRLDQAGIRLDNTRIMDLINSDIRSPFKGMVDFKIEGSSGKLPYPGMLTLARRFRGLRMHSTDTEAAPSFSPFFKTIFSQGINGKRYTEKKKAWMEVMWFEHFSALWSQVRDQIADEGGGYGALWGYNTNLLKIVTLQEMQNLFLKWIHERMELIDSPEATRKLAEQYFTRLKPKFFEKDWKLPSLQSGTGRVFLRAALQAAIKTPKFGYDSPLFVGVVAKKR